MLALVPDRAFSGLDSMEAAELGGWKFWWRYSAANPCLHWKVEFHETG
jgi:hypothetical protein